MKHDPNTRCPACEEEFPMDAAGQSITCPNCGLQFSARPTNIWKFLEKREAALRDDNQVYLQRIEGNQKRQQLYHNPKGEDPQWPDRRFDVQYEGGVDRAEPFEEPISDLHLVLDDLLSQWNVGSIFRTAECMGWGSIHLGGITSMPPARGVVRVSLGAENSVPWDYHANLLELIEKRVAEGFIPVALEQTDDACDLFDFVPPKKMLLVIGNEVSGISNEALQACPQRIQIPMAGRKVSLNVAVSFGIAAYEIRQKWLAAHPS